MIFFNNKTTKTCILFPTTKTSMSSKLTKSSKAKQTKATAATAANVAFKKLTPKEVQALYESKWASSTETRPVTEVFVYNVQAETVQKTRLYLDYRGLWKYSSEPSGPLIPARKIVTESPEEAVEALHTNGFTIFRSYDVTPIDVSPEEFADRAVQLAHTNEELLQRTKVCDEQLRKFVMNTTGIRKFGLFWGVPQSPELRQLQTEISLGETRKVFQRFYGTSNLITSADMLSGNTTSYTPREHHMHVDLQGTQQYGVGNDRRAIQAQTCVGTFSSRNVASLGFNNIKFTMNDELVNCRADRNDVVQDLMARIRTRHNNAARHQKIEVGQFYQKKRYILIFDNLSSGDTIFWREDTIHGTIPASVPANERVSDRRKVSCVNMHPSHAPLINKTIDPLHYDQLKAQGFTSCHSVFTSFVSGSLRTRQFGFHPGTLGIDYSTQEGKDQKNAIVELESFVARAMCST